MSIGVNVLISLVEKATQSLHDDFDIEIMESHHKHKVDSPSGTAIRLGEEVAKASNRNLKKMLYLVAKVFKKNVKRKR
jgi:4-hydroxy-tetrahydrodipicolinate reductase